MVKYIYAFPNWQGERPWRDQQSQSPGKVVCFAVFVATPIPLCYFQR